MLVVAMSDHDQYLGMGTPYPNNPINPDAEVKKQKNKKTTVTGCRPPWPPSIPPQPIPDDARLCAKRGRWVHRCIRRRPELCCG